jgi:predicted metal-dependent peptidase
VALTPNQLLATGMIRATDPRNGMAPYCAVILRGLLRRQMTEALEQELGPGRATLAVTNDGILYWSATYVAKCSVDELAFGLIHEAMHVLLDHFSRAKAINVPPEHYSIVNLAQDACINDELRKAFEKTHPKIGADAVYSSTLKQPPGLIWEERYRRLLKNAVTIKMPMCGGSAHNPLPGEKMGSGASGEGRSQAQLDRLRKETAQAVREHNAKQPGTVPNELAVWADALLTPPRIDWRTQLGALVRDAIAYRPGVGHSTFLRRSRRQAGVGYGIGCPVMPGQHQAVPRVGVLLDLSGSMLGERLRSATSELQGVLAAVGAAVTVCTVDAALQGIKECASLADAVELYKGGGGTILTPGFDALSARKPSMEVVVALTDGEIGGGFPQEEPPYRVVWCICGDTQFTPPYGDVVYVDSDEA